MPRGRPPNRPNLRPSGLEDRSPKGIARPTARVPPRDEFSGRTVLSGPQRLAITEYLVDLDPRAAFARAGLDPKLGPRFFAHPRVQSILAEEKRARSSRLQIYGDEVLRRLTMLATFDVNELVSGYRTACRHCWGVDHEHQYTDLEHRHAAAAHLREQLRLPERDRVPFDERGGPGYDANRPPMRGPTWVERERRSGNPVAAESQNSDHSCPACHGDGELRVVIKDTRDLSPAARLAYDGIRVAAGGGAEIKIRDRSWAEKMIAERVGWAPPPAPLADPDPTRLTDEQLDGVVGRLIERGAIAIEGNLIDAAGVDQEELSPQLPDPDGPQGSPLRADEVEDSAEEGP